jgi:hypothetical protein
MGFRHSPSPLKKRDMSEKNLFLIEAYKRGFRVSDCGNFISTTVKKHPQRVLVNGYPVISVRVGKKTLKIYWHRIQAYQKYGEDLFKKGIVVRHKNSIRTDCSSENILIGNQSQNMMDCPREDRMKRAIHATSFVRKYSKDTVKEFHSKSNSYKKTMNEFGITSKGTLHYILNN